MLDSAIAPVLEARGIVKVFGQHRALDGVDFAALPGEVHALLGENGAGKSTLIKILTGAYQPDAGELLLEGQPITLRDPLHGQGYGIGTVYQEVNLLPNRSVAENLFLGRQPTRFGMVRRREIEARAKGWTLMCGPSFRNFRWRCSRLLPLRGRWNCRARCWCWTSRRPVLTATKCSGCSM